MQVLQCKYNDFILIPSNGIDRQASRFKTADGVAVSVKYVSTWNNKDGQYDGDLDFICKKKYGTPFSTIRSIWIGRLGRVDDYWHLIELKKDA